MDYQIFKDEVKILWQEYAEINISEGTNIVFLKPNTKKLSLLVVDINDGIQYFFNYDLEKYSYDKIFEDLHFMLYGIGKLNESNA